MRTQDKFIVKRKVMVYIKTLLLFILQPRLRVAVVTFAEFLFTETPLTKTLCVWF